MTDVGPAVDQAGGIGVAAAETRLVRLDSTSGVAFQKSVAAWAQSAVEVLETTSDLQRRIAVRDEALRVAARPARRRSEQSRR